ncbi:MAG: dihydroorotate dehydrogenase electron transfer subunit [Candidatus Aminicenantes bacterium]|nr:dihydroorotate dehydrogenase electron transfer subunit [Candidatus Aminicenantes bacterium]
MDEAWHNAAMQDESGLIWETRCLGKDYYLLKILAPKISHEAQPGNFVMIRVSPSFDPLLRRPFGILQSQPPYIWLYFQVNGRGTELLKARQSGDRLDILGPLGNSFPALPGKKILLIAGGRGIVPLFSYAKTYAEKQPLILLYGGRSATDLNLLEEISAIPLHKNYIFSEDGSCGEKGLLTSGLEKIINAQRPHITMACGPEAMLAALAGILKSRNMENYVSLEAIMGCGFGVCHSCVVTAADGRYRKVCDEGPVFPMQDIAWPS